MVYLYRYSTHVGRPETLTRVAVRLYYVMLASGDRVRACSSSEVFSRVQNFNILNSPDPTETTNLFFFPALPVSLCYNNNNNIFASIARFVP